MRADGSRLTKLTSDGDADNFSGSWSPDGGKIAFSARGSKAAKGEIFVMNADGSGIRQLTMHPAHDSAPVWSPDGKRIAFISDRDGKDHENQIYVMRANGSEQTTFNKNRDA